MPAAPTGDAVLRWVGAAAIGAVLGWGDRVWALFGEGTLLVLVIGACSVVAGARSARPWPAAAPLRALGEVSYEVYLTHMFVVFAVVELWSALGLGQDAGAWAYGPALLGSYALGLGVQRSVSEPANRWVRARWAGQADRA
jgi:peptidoglycan/LPS O-acetylase OafA/YrhL